MFHRRPLSVAVEVKKSRKGKRMLDSSTTFHIPLHSSEVTALGRRKRRRPREGAGEEKNKALVSLSTSIPSPSSSLSQLPSPSPFKAEEEYKLLGIEFFQCDALQLAPKLLGKLLRKDDVILQITEVEAYRQNDTACHGRFGITARTAPVFGPGGRSYVYLCYGIHSMLNVVADKEGIGAAVLIRSCAPISGLETIQSRRGQATNKPILLTGPGKVGQALGLTTDWSNHPLYTPGGVTTFRRM
ncbi:hypothetical protein SUGI_0262320 [Cryptomeria japonica]|nr:hypothetical protein SUGI_0262320 [Cryptomeria japonica]